MLYLSNAPLSTSESLQIGLGIKIPLKRDASGPEGIALGSLWIPLLTTNRRILDKNNFPHTRDL